MRIKVSGCKNSEACMVKADVASALALVKVANVFCLKCWQCGRTERASGAVVVEMHDPSAVDLLSVGLSLVGGENEKL